MSVCGVRAPESLSSVGRSAGHPALEARMKIMENISNKVNISVNGIHYYFPFTYKLTDKI